MTTATDSLSWVKKPSKYIFSVLTGATPSTYEKSYWNGNIYWATPEDIKALKGKFIFDTNRKITTKAVDSCLIQLAPLGSIVLTTRAPIINIALAGVELCTNQGCKILVPNFKDVNTNYLYYQLLARKHELIALAQSTMSQELRINDLRNFELWLPPIYLQNKIAKYLDEETAKVDKLLVMKEKFLELLAERRHTFIADALKSIHPKVYLESHLKEYNDSNYISAANIKQLPVVTTPQEEQPLAIEYYIQSVTLNLDELIRTTRSTIKLLYERRTTLISAAMTPGASAQ